MTATVFKFAISRSPKTVNAEGTPEGIDLIIDRLLSTIREENEAIGRRTPVDYRDFNLRKSQGLLELTRAMPTFRGAAAGLQARRLLSDLIDELKRNQDLLAIQLKAARRIGDIVAKAIQEGQSDGTYSAHAWRYRDE